MVHGDGMDAGPTLAGGALAADAGREQGVRLRRFAFRPVRHAVWRFDLVWSLALCMMPKEHACVAHLR